jgi:hypothetical protein
MHYLRSLVVFVLALSLAASGRAQSPAPAQESQQQQQVAKLPGFTTLVALVNLGSGAVRVVVVLDPVSDGSAAALKAVQYVLDSNSSKRLRVYVVWSAQTAQATQLRAAARSNEVRDHRVAYFYDAEGSVADAFRGVAGSGATPATDILLLYDTDARLALDPPAPAMWMSANPKIKGAALDEKQLSAHANQMVRRVEAKVSDGTQQKP